MTPKPPSSSEGSSLPPRSRPNLGDLVKDTTELDLWAFDDLDPEEEIPKPSAPPVSSSIPVARANRAKKPVEPAEPVEPPPSNPAAEKDGSRVIVSKEPLKARSGANTGPPESGTDFDELDDLKHLDEGEVPVLSIHPSLVGAPAERPAVQDAVIEEFVPPANQSEELSPVAHENAKPVSLIPRLGLSKLEWFGLWTLCAILLVGGGVVFFNSIHRLPTGAQRLNAGDFPVAGRHVTILSAETFWRPPVAEGKYAETFRRGTQLLPVVDLKTSGGPAAVRVFFRDQDGVVMGDAVTRSIKPGVPLQIAATAGFEDVGMHAAYRTGQSKPWTIQVFEASSETATNAEFKKLFEINISTDRR